LSHLGYDPGHADPAAVTPAPAPALPKRAAATAHAPAMLITAREKGHADRAPAAEAAYSLSRAVR